MLGFPKTMAIAIFDVAPEVVGRKRCGENDQTFAVHPSIAQLEKEKRFTVEIMLALVACGHKRPSWESLNRFKE